MVVKMDLKKRCLFVLSGVCNSLGKSLATEMCRRFRPGSCSILIGASEENLQEVRKEIEYLNNGIKVVCCHVKDWQAMNTLAYRKILNDVVGTYPAEFFEMAFVVHNEGLGATHDLMEPQNSTTWLSYVQENLNAAVALNQEFINHSALNKVKKLVVNITSSLQVQPFVYNSLMCSCKKARDMYFRSMAAAESRNGVVVINYAPGILETHKAVIDANDNVVDVADIEPNEKLLQLPRVQPEASTLGLVNILQKVSFYSGHDVDYYDTYNL